MNVDCMYGGHMYIYIHTLPCSYTYCLQVYVIIILCHYYGTTQVDWQCEMLSYIEKPHAFCVLVLFLISLNNMVVA